MRMFEERLAAQRTRVSQIVLGNRRAAVHIGGCAETRGDFLKIDILQVELALAAVQNGHKYLLLSVGGWWLLWLRQCQWAFLATGLEKYNQQAQQNDRTHGHPRWF